MQTQLTALLVPTDENSRFAISNNYLWFSKREYYIKSLSYQPQQLLILSDKDVKENDVCLYENEDGLQLVVKLDHRYFNRNNILYWHDVYSRSFSYEEKYLTKIIASSQQLEGTLPISFTDMELFAEKWNNGEKVVKVTIEPVIATKTNGTINLIWEEPKEFVKDIVEETIEEKIMRTLIEAIPDECILKYKPHLTIKSSELNEK